jgi:hypothetical protein
MAADEVLEYCVAYRPLQREKGKPTLPMGFVKINGIFHEVKRFTEDSLEISNQMSVKYC